MKLYDSVDGIRTYLTSLESLNKLFSERRQAGYQRGERMEEFCVLGRFWLDTCGNCSPIVSNAPADLFKVSPYSDEHVPDVMTREQVFIFMRGEYFSSSAERAIPPVYARCTVCDKPWSIENCHDIVFNTGHEEASLEEFVGKPLGSVKKISALEGKKQYFITRDLVINVTREGKPDGNMSDGRPWFRVNDDYIIQAGDVLSLQVGEFTHDACYRKDLAARQRIQMEEAFTKAGFPKVNLITIPNEYHGGGNGRKTPYYAAPWYHAQVGDGPVFKIGWRKRVISIEWKDTGKSLPDLFEGEDVTKESYLVHAYGYDKAAEYLAKLVPALEA